jgi:hypothetical protein
MRQFFNQWIRARLRGGSHEELKGYAARIAENAWRVALCFACFENPDTPKLTADIAKRACTLVEWYAKEARQMLGFMDTECRIARYQKIETALQIYQGEASLRDLRRTHNILPDMVEAACRDYSDHLEIIKVKPPTGGRPAIVVKLKKPKK